MLSASHNRAYQDFLTLLTGFNNFVLDLAPEAEVSAIKEKFQPMQNFFDNNIVVLDGKNIEEKNIPRWESIQREIKREFKLLTTDIFFLASARQNTTKIKRLKSIEERTSNLVNYCQKLLKE